MIIEKEPPMRSKDTENRQAIQETQLVGFNKYNASTLKDNVNLEKVREARRVLRRRYANRKNLQKIFHLWDENKIGEITVENVFNMAKRLGLNMNFDESRVLLASADKNESGTLTIDEFLDLVYNKDDALNVNLENLSSIISFIFNI